MDTEALKSFFNTPLAKVFRYDEPVPFWEEPEACLYNRDRFMCEVMGQPFWEEPWELRMLREEEEFRRRVCPGCGYGQTSGGLALVLRPNLIVDFNDSKLCAECRPAKRGGRRPGEPVLKPLIYPEASQIKIHQS